MRTPTARAAGIAKLAVVVDAHERYGYTFAGKPVVTTRQALACGDYGLMADGRLVAVVERKSLSDLVSSLLSGDLKYRMTGLVEMQISFPNVPIVFCQTRKLAQEYTYRFLAAAHRWLADNEDAATVFEPPPSATEASMTEIHRWGRSRGLPVSDRGRIARDILDAWRDAHHG